MSADSKQSHGSLSCRRTAGSADTRAARLHARIPWADADDATAGTDKKNYRRLKNGVQRPLPGQLIHALTVFQLAPRFSGPRQWRCSGPSVALHRRPSVGRLSVLVAEDGFFESVDCVHRLFRVLPTILTRLERFATAARGATSRFRPGEVPPMSLADRPVPLFLALQRPLHYLFMTVSAASQAAWRERRD
jgi:hypothetical protein